MSMIRPSWEIEAQLKAFEATLPASLTAPPARDFAATLQWESWQNHRQELKREIEAARLAESRHSTNHPELAEKSKTGLKAKI
jgi:hypothetical protein